MGIIYRRLTRVYAHIYCSHATHVSQLGIEALVNSTFKHMLYFMLGDACVTYA